MNLCLNLSGLIFADQFGTRFALTEYFTTPADELFPVKKQDEGQFSGILN